MFEYPARPLEWILKTNRRNMLDRVKNLHRCVKGQVLHTYYRFLGTKNLLNRALWILRMTLEMFLTTLKPVRNPRDLNALHEESYWFNHGMEEISSELNEEPGIDSGCFAEGLINWIFRRVWGLSNRAHTRALSVFEKNLTSSRMINKAERDVRTKFGDTGQESVLFLLKGYPVDPSLSVLCARENAGSWNGKRAEAGWIVCTKRYVYDALVSEAEDDVSGYRKPGPAVIEPQGPERELFEALYFSQRMSITDARVAAEALTA